MEQDANHSTLQSNSKNKFYKDMLLKFCKNILIFNLSYIKIEEEHKPQRDIKRIKSKK